jgi:hypothetical protein
MAIRQRDFEKALDLNAQAIEIIKSTPHGDRQLERCFKTANGF